MMLLADGQEHDDLHSFKYSDRHIVVLYLNECNYRRTDSRDGQNGKI